MNVRRRQPRRLAFAFKNSFTQSIKLKIFSAKSLPLGINQNEPLWMHKARGTVGFQVPDEVTRMYGLAPQIGSLGEKLTTASRSTITPSSVQEG